MSILWCVSSILLTSSGIRKNKSLNSVIGFSVARLCSAFNFSLCSSFSFKSYEDSVAVVFSCLLMRGIRAQVDKTSLLFITFTLSSYHISYYQRNGISGKSGVGEKQPGKGKKLLALKPSLIYLMRKKRKLLFH